MPGPTPADFEAAGLYDPDDDTVSGRLDLLTWLAEEGFTIEEMRRGAETDALAAMVADRWLLGGPTLERSEAIEHSGLSESTFDAVTVALGLGPIRGAAGGAMPYTEALLEIYRFVGVAETFFSASEVQALVRTIGSSIGRMAEASVSVFLTDIESEHVIAGRSERELGQLVLDATKLLDGFGQLLDPVMRRHVLQAIERTRLSAIDDRERFQYRYAVGFVDLVGFTPMSASLSARELTEFMADFDARSHDAVIGAGARVVKLIGDEVMFVATDATQGCRAGHALIEAFATADGVAPRGGMAYGPVALRGGDYFGSVVNLASRLTAEATPGELLVSDELAAVAACTFRPAGERTLKGFGEPVDVHTLVAARPDAAPSA